jgi:hypothetical protein
VRVVLVVRAHLEAGLAAGAAGLGDAWPRAAEPSSRRLEYSVRSIADGIFCDGIHRVEVDSTDDSMEYTGSGCQNGCNADGSVVPRQPAACVDIRGRRCYSARTVLVMCAFMGILYIKEIGEGE